MSPKRNAVFLGFASRTVLTGSDTRFKSEIRYSLTNEPTDFMLFAVDYKNLDGDVLSSIMSKFVLYNVNSGFMTLMVKEFPEKLGDPELFRRAKSQELDVTTIIEAIRIEINNAAQ